MQRPEDVLAESLAATGARHAFGVPGGGANLEMIAALERAGLSFILGHGETSACIAASVYGHVSGSVSAAVVTRGPGAAAATNGAAQATLDRHPLVLVTDSVATADRPRVAHQRIDQTAMLTPVAKASGPLAAENARVAAHMAASDPPGTVHLDRDPTLDGPTISPPDDPVPSDQASIDELRATIRRADRPVVIVGVGAPPTPAIRATLERFSAPVLTTYQAVGTVPTESPVTAGLFTGGTPERRLLDRADLIVLVGLDMVEPIPTSWTATAPVVSIASRPTVEDYAPISLEVVGDVVALVATCLDGDHDWASDTGADQREWTRHALRDHQPVDGLGPVEAVDVLRRELPSDPVTTTVDAGAHFLAIMPLWRVDEPRRLLISNGLATMGYAVPAAIGAALARPDEPVVALTGDGGLGMCLAELETIGRLRLPITVIVFDDAALSLIRIKQRDGQGGSAGCVCSATRRSPCGPTPQPARRRQRRTAGGSPKHWPTPPISAPHSPTGRRRSSTSAADSSPVRATSGVVRR